MKNRFGSYFLLLLLTIFLGPAFSAEKEGVLNKLLAPGPLIKGHKDLENKDCLRCHDAGKGVPNEKCLQCHKEVKAFVDKKRGFHGLHTKNCMECHREHKGRAFDSIFVDQNNFDHRQLTGYALEGRHAEINCKECHKRKQGPKSVRAGDIRYFGTKGSTCVGCHKKDDVHFFKNKFAKKDCNECHNVESWKQDIRFEHTRDTGYKLIGKHAELKCNDCHQVKKKTFKYKWPRLKSDQCLSCHANVHKGNLSPRFGGGGKCTTCHTQETWKIENFDHNMTGYKLVGRHRELNCTDCHKQRAVVLKSSSTKNYKWVGLKTQCLSCHKDYHHFGKTHNPHFGNLNNCLACHTEQSWKPPLNFNHDKHTRYVIDGAHLELKCKDCHVSKTTRKYVYQFPQLSEKTCETCHKNPHIGVFSKELLAKKCTTCHTTSSWSLLKNGQGFDHNKTRFPLTGSHLRAQCTDCHGPSGKQVYKFKSAEAKFCIDCHKNIHTQQFSKAFSTQACTSCHDTRSFKERLPFDHNKTQYKLSGAHSKLQCQDCHKPSSTPAFRLEWPNVSKRASSPSSPSSNSGSSLFHPSKYLFPEVASKQCLACHKDYHAGQLDTRCTQCHTDNAWKPVSFNHDTQSHFPLKFKHAQVKCGECHKPTSQTTFYKGAQRPVVRFKPLPQQCVDCHKDPHNGELGNRCQDCHNEKDWKSTRNFHKNFTLIGVHYNLDCAECHKDGKKLAGMSAQCYTCHQKDDVHSGTLPNCKECHTQHVWELSRFKHSLTQFPLRGAHRTLDCMECHKTGVYKGLNPQCVSCHLADYNANPRPEHNGILNCSECHRNQFSFGSQR